MRVLIAVTHLLGAGHLTRAAALARAFAASSHEAVLVSGGAPAPLVRLDGVRLVQLPPLRVAGTDFSRPLGPDGLPADAALLDRRRTLLLDTLDAVAPDAVVTELFPFGRRALAAEFLALVEAARRRRSLVLASVRDILVAPGKPERVAQAHDRVAGLYDAVLVHGDPGLVPLDASWPLDARTAAAIRYTGYVDERGAAAPPGTRAGVLVAAGSSAAGLGLFRAAAEAARRRPDLGWRILVGHGVPETAFAAIKHGLPDGVVARARPDYRALLAGSALSVSQCGYNTAVDLLATGTRAVLVPFEAGRETEQRLRAGRLAARGLAQVLPEAALTAEALLSAVTAGLAAPPPSRHGVDLGGAARSVAIVEDLAARATARRTRSPPPKPPHPPHPEVAQRSGALEGGLRPAARSLEPCFEAADAALQDEVVDRGSAGFARRTTIRTDNRYDRLARALDRVGADGIRVPVWWRDDDAVAASPALDRLLGLAEAHAAPILLAVIPARVEPSLGWRLADAPDVGVAVHGLAHDNHAPPGEKPAEFGAHRPLDRLAADAAAGLRLARDRLPPDKLLPVFVPPWNRLAPDLAAVLPGLGYRGLSASAPPDDAASGGAKKRGSSAGPGVPGLARADATLDPIDWRGTRSLRDPDAMLRDLAEGIAGWPGRPVGLLTHHRVHDDAVWHFLDGLLTVLRDHPAVTLLDPRALFGLAAVDSGASTASVPVSACARIG